MKTTVLYLSILVALSSCGSFNYLTISHPYLEPENKKFTATDSTLKVSYGFENGKLELTIENHSGNPVIIDWKKSSVITNGRAVSLFNNNAAINGSAQTYKYIQPSVTSINGTVSLPEGTDFIPPAAVINKTTVAAIVASQNFAFSENEKITKTNADNKQKKFAGKTYTATESPYKIRVYITYRGGNERDRVIENGFYVSEIINTSKGPEAMQLFYNNDQAFVYRFVNAPADPQPGAY